jgi:hypothetical protein
MHQRTEAIIPSRSETAGWYPSSRFDVELPKAQTVLAAAARDGEQAGRASSTLRGA